MARKPGSRGVETGEAESRTGLRKGVGGGAGSQEMEQAKHNTIRERTIKRMLTLQS